MAPYVTPVVYPGLSPEESFEQIVDTLEHLDKTLNSVFDAVVLKVRDNFQRIQDISKRVSVVETKVDRLRGRNKATVILSVAKYPKPVENNHHEKLHASVDPAWTVVSHTSVDIIRDRAPRPLEDWKVDLEKEFAARPNRPQKKEKGKSGQPQEEEGLGRLPDSISSVADMLLFNSQDNPYRKYTNFDNLVGKKKEKHDTKKEIGAAPETIKTGEELEYVGDAGDVAYKPKLNDLPDLDLPDNLKLPNVASDIAWSVSETESMFVSTIAPSGLLELPSFPTSGDMDLPAPAVNADLPAPPPPPPASVAPPPPPPPSANVPPPPPPPPSAAAPPPPPPPPVAPMEAAIEVPRAVEESKTEGDRGDLLASIRKGKELRSIKQARKEKKNAPEDKDATSNKGRNDVGAMDPMTALHEALKRRRLGISDARDRQRSGSTTADLSGEQDDKEWHD